MSNPVAAGSKVQVQIPDKDVKKEGPTARVTPESKREEFRRYLERAGVLDALTRVLIGLYEEPEKPLNPMEYFLDQLAGGVPAKQELEQLQEEYTRLEARAAELEEENERLRIRLEKYEPNNDEGEELGESDGPPPPPPAEVVPPGPEVVL